jgi:hypothetical protein
MFLSEVREVEAGSMIQYAEAGRAQLKALAIKKSSREKVAGEARDGSARWLSTT